MPADIRQKYSQGHAPAVSTETPEEKLKELKATLKVSQEKLDNLTKDRDALNAEIVTLIKVVDDTKKVLGGYEGAYPGLLKDGETIDNYDNSKIEFLNCKLSKDRQKQIDDVVTCYDAETDKLQTTAADSDTEAKDKKGESDAARTQYQKATDAYNELNGLLKFLSEKDASLKKLMGDIDALEVKRNYDAEYLQLVYFLEPSAKEFHHCLRTVDKFKAELYAAVIAQDTAWTVARQKKDDADVAQTKADVAQALYNKNLADRNAELLKRVNALPAQAPDKTYATSA